MGAMAFGALGDAQRAWESPCSLRSITRHPTDAMAVHQSEPYVIASDALVHAAEFTQDSGLRQLGELHCVPHAVRSANENEGHTSPMWAPSVRRIACDHTNAVSGMSGGGCVSGVWQALCAVPSTRVDAVTAADRSLADSSPP